MGESGLKYKMKDLCTINGASYNKNDNFSYIHYLDTANITEGKIATIQKLVVGKDKIPSRAKRKVKKNDIIISTVRPNLKHYGMIKNPVENMIVSTGFAVLTPKEHIVHPDYLYWYLTQQKVTDYLSGIAETSTTAYPSITADVIANIEIDLPNYETQEKVAKILTVLFNRIALNDEMTKTLDEIAKAIFKHWFIDFEFPNEKGEPYQESGGMFVQSEKGMIPEDWEFSPLEDVCQIKYGKNLPTKKLLANGYPVYGGNGIIGYYDEYLYEEPQVIVSCRGAASGKVLNTVPFSYVTNNSLVLERKDQRIHYEYLKYYCSYYSFYQYTTGSAQPQLTVQNIKDFPILIPKKDVLQNFQQVVKPIEELKYQLALQSEKLRMLRDTLQPKLMSGEIQIEE